MNVKRWVLRAARVVLGGLVLLAVAGAAYQAIATAQDAQRNPPPGRLIDVGGYRLHVQCVGQGSPTVLFESALGAGSPTWAWVQPAVARSTRACAYDRAGEGWSDLGPDPRDAEQIARELHALLTGADVAPPYVLVGHSFGGLYVRAFADLYPTDVVGLVLVDASHPDQWARSDEARAVQRANEQSAAVAPWLARLGLLRVSGYVRVDPDLPAAQQAQLRALVDTSKLWDSYSAVFRVTDRTMAEVRQARPLGKLPLVVLTATSHGMPPDAEVLHQQLQNELAALSTSATHRVLDGATHVSLVHNREQSAVTVAAIEQVLAAAR
jgi:pimeloyl-ACP methyl ester carboxylesterase